MLELSLQKADGPRRLGSSSEALGGRLREHDVAGRRCQHLDYAVACNVTIENGWSARLSGGEQRPQCQLRPADVDQNRIESRHVLFCHRFDRLVQGRIVEGHDQALALIIDKDRRDGRAGACHTDHARLCRFRLEKLIESHNELRLPFAGY